MGKSNLKTVLYCLELDIALGRERARLFLITRGKLHVIFD